MKTKPVAVAVAALGVAVVALSGCASSFTDSYLVGERYFLADANTSPVIILGVDDWDTLQRRVLVTPGPHVIRVQAPPVPGAPNETAALKVDIQPCHQYYIVAWRQTPMMPTFEPRVDYAAPLSGCTAEKKS